MSKPDGVARFVALLQEGREAMAYLFERFEMAYRSAGTLAGRERVAEGFLERLERAGVLHDARHGDGVLRQGILAIRLGEVLRMPEGDVRRLLDSRRARRRHGFAQTQPDAQRVEPVRHERGNHVVDLGMGPLAPAATLSNARRLAELRLLGCLIKHPAVLGLPVPAVGGLSLEEALPPGSFQSAAAPAWDWAVARALEFLSSAELTVGGPAAAIAEAQASGHEGVVRVLLHAADELMVLGLDGAVSQQAVADEALRAANYLVGERERGMQAPVSGGDLATFLNAQLAARLRAGDDPSRRGRR
jgi:hypothetical protein